MVNVTFDPVLLNLFAETVDTGSAPVLCADGAGGRNPCDGWQQA